MIILDTNIVSELSQSKPDKNTYNWLHLQERNEVYTCAPVIGELSFGAHKVLIRNNSDRYILSLNNIVNIIFIDKILDFNLDSAHIYGEIRALGGAAGKSRSHLDLMIAAICIANGATLATRNIKDFEGLDLKLINPFEAI